MRLYFYIGILMLFPSLAFAGVRINEIAWMGTGVSSNDEWIELYNDGSEDVNLDGWIIGAEDGQPEINLTGVIKTNSFFLLERTNDTSVPNILADLIYVGSLENGGEVLVLKNSDGIKIQKIDTQDGWQAGDNSTKQTMQWNGQKWITADATPKAQNSNLVIGLPSGEMEEQQKVQTPSSAIGWPSEPQIYANAGKDITTVAGAGVAFHGQTLGINKEPLSSARYLWSFGDGSTKEGKTVIHFYKYPAKYIVVLNVSSGQYSTSDNLVVDVRPNKLEIIEANNEYIELKNGSPFDLDISGWFLRSGKKTFRFPKTTLIGANLGLPIPSSITEITGVSLSNEINILYPNGAVAFNFDRFVQPKIVPVVSVAEKINETKDTAIAIPSAMEEGEVAGEEDELDNSQIAAVAGYTTNTFWNIKNTFLIVLGLGFFVGTSLVFSRRQNQNIPDKNTADEFEILE